MFPTPTDVSLVVHMGLPKTGTTFLQNHVFRPFGEIADFGKTPAYHVERPHVRQALRVVASQPDHKFRAHAAEVKALLIAELEEAKRLNPEAPCPLLSYEGFFHPDSLHPVEIYSRLESIFGRFKILLTIRHQFAWIASLYLYKFYRFLNGGGPSFEVWTKEARRRSGWNAFVCCDYWSVIQQLTERVGREHILVKPMEGFIQAGDRDALTRLAAFLTVDADALAAQFSRAEPTKQRVDELGFLLGRTLYESQAADLSDDERLLLKRLFRKIHTQLKGEHQKADVPFDVIERCFSPAELNAIRVGNIALSDHIGQNLARFGYP